MKTTIQYSILFCCCLLVFGLVVGAAADTYQPPPPKTVCTNKCTHYKTVQGHCVDYEWTGTTKQCCSWKNVGKGKCEEYKTISKCDKYSKPRKLCLGHGYTQVCKKVTKHKYCTNYEWREVCKANGKNHGCDSYGYHFVCTKSDHVARCSLYTYVPRITYHYKRRCSKYSVQQYCAKYKKIYKTVRKWVPMTKKHYKGWMDHYYKQVLERKFHTVCVAYASKKTCCAHQRVRFAKKIGYDKKCVKFVKENYCVAKKRIRFCEKWSRHSSFCAVKQKVRVCTQHKVKHFCCVYKPVPFCQKYKRVGPKCIKKSHKKYCVKKSEGYKVCAKYEHVGGKRVCKKKADRSVCDRYQQTCTKVDTYN